MCVIVCVQTGLSYVYRSCQTMVKVIFFCFADQNLDKYNIPFYLTFLIKIFFKLFIVLIISR